MIKEKDKVMYMDIAERVAQRSYAKRLQVGCVIEKNGSIISFGWNGMPSGYDNCCEHVDENGHEVTNREVQHAELNAILNYRGGSLEGAKLYVTLFPCNECAKAIIQCGIKAVIYGDDKYGDTSAVKASKRMMEAAGVEYIPYKKSGKEIKIKL